MNTNNPIDCITHWYRIARNLRQAAAKISDTYPDASHDMAARADVYQRCADQLAATMITEHVEAKAVA